MKNLVLFCILLIAISFLNSCNEEDSAFNFNSNKVENDYFSIEKVNLDSYRNVLESWNLQNESDFTNYNNFDITEGSFINYKNSNQTAIVLRDKDYNMDQKNRKSLCYILNEKNNVINAFVIKETNSLGVDFYDVTGVKTFQAKLNTESQKLEVFNRQEVGETGKLRTNWQAVEDCVDGWYDLSGFYGWAMTVISAFLPETFAAVVAGCTAQNTVVI